MSHGLSTSVLPTDQDDILISTHNGQTIHALAGNDDIKANNFSLTLFGDGGDDTIEASGGVTGSMYGGDGNDVIYGTSAIATLFEGGKGADRIELDWSTSFPAKATLSFMDSTQAVRLVLNANGSGYGTAGDAKGDVYLGLFARVLGSAGNDWITDETAIGALDAPQSQKFDGGAGNDRLLLGTGDDTGLGGAGNDMISGGLGADRLLGGDGDDTLFGGPGFDVMRGGLGTDHFAFDQYDMGDTTFAGGAASLRISDFHFIEGDKIDLSLIDARSGQPSQQAFTFLGTDAFTGQQGEVRYEVTAHGVTVIAWDGSLQGNVATGHFDPVYLTFLVQGVTSLTAEDFIL